jgi:DnaJ homolog subfamily C member 7
MADLAKEQYEDEQGSGGSDAEFFSDDAISGEEEEEEEEEPLTPEEEAAEWKQEGNQKYSKKDYFGAIDAYTKAIELVPEDHTYYGNRSAANMMIGRYDHVEKDCVKAVELNRDYTKCYLRLAKARLALGKFDQAEDSLTQLYLRDVRSTDVPNERKKVSLSRDRLHRAKQYLDNKKYAHALSVLHSAQEHCPASPALKEYKVEALVGTKKYEEAYVLSTNMLRNNPRDPIALFWRAKAQYYQGEFEKAIQVMKNLMRMDPDNKKCMIEVRKMRKLETMKQEGNSFFKQRSWTEAISTYTDCLNIDPDNLLFNAKLLCNRAACLMKLKRYQEAVADCTNAIENQGDYTKAYMRRGQCYQELGGLEALEMAQRDYAKAQELAGEGTAMHRDLERSLRNIKLLMKKAKRKDYYKLLNVRERATVEEIKKAYKKAALKYHPDRQSRKSEAEKEAATKMFKDCAEGLEILSDPQKRHMYDQGMDLEEINQGGHHHGHGHGGMGGIDPNTIFQMFMGGGGGGGMGGGRRRRSPFM